MTIATVATKTYFAHPRAIVETNDIGPGTRIWAFAHVMSGARVGFDCNICDHAFIETGATLGNNVTVKNGVAIWRGVTIEDHVFLGPNCVLTNDYNPRAYIKKSGAALETTLICANATIGANATIVCGVTIGKYSFIGAGTVVIRSVPNFALVVGNPARHVGWMCKCATSIPLLPLDSLVVCPHCHTRFRLTSKGLIVVDGGQRPIAINNRTRTTQPTKPTPISARSKIHHWLRGDDTSS